MWITHYHRHRHHHHPLPTLDQHLEEDSLLLLAFRQFGQHLTFNWVILERRSAETWNFENTVGEHCSSTSTAASSSSSSSSSCCSSSADYALLCLHHHFLFSCQCPYSVRCVLVLFFFACTSGAPGQRISESLKRYEEAMVMAVVGLQWRGSQSKSAH